MREWIITALAFLGHARRHIAANLANGCTLDHFATGI